MSEAEIISWSTPKSKRNSFKPKTIAALLSLLPPEDLRALGLALAHHQRSIRSRRVMSTPLADLLDDLR